MALDELLQRKLMMDRLRDLDGRPAPEANSELSERDLCKIFDQISLIVEQDFELLTCRTKDGSMETRYFPMADYKESHIIKQVVLHTHITVGSLSHLAFDCQ